MEGLPEAPVPLPRLERVLAGRDFANADVGIVAIDLRSGGTVVSHLADRPLLPASTMKVFTTACALDVLGPAWTTHTEILAQEPVAPGGVIAGPIYLRGGGDPLLRPEDLWGSLRQLEALGVARVEGGVIVDASLFTNEARPSTWPPRRVGDPYDAPQAAFSFAWNALEVIVRPGARMGAPAEVATQPLANAVALVNLAKTGASTKLTVAHDETPGAAAVITVRGTIAAGAPPSRHWVHMGDPIAAGLAALQDLFARAGIAVKGPFERGVVPPEARLLVMRPSDPLRDIVAKINKTSSNFGAEMLLRWLDPRIPLAPASPAGGAEAIEACLDTWGVPRAALVIADGSGYSRENRVSAHALALVLQRAWNDTVWGPEFVVSLPRAGDDGTLRTRLRSLEGRLRAKTGTLRDVASLAGYAWTKDGTPIAFAIIANGRNGAGAARGWTDDVVIALLQDLDARRLEAKTAAQSSRRVN